MNTYRTDSRQQRHAWRSIIIPFLLLAFVPPAACDSEDPASSDEGGSGVEALVDPSGREPGAGPSGVERMPRVELGPGERYEIVLGSDTDYVDGHPDIASFEFDGLETIKVRPRQGARLPFKVGRILLSRDNFVARRIVGIQRVGGELQYRTVPAEASEAFEKIDIEADMPLGDLSADKLKITWIDIETSKEKTKNVSLSTTLLDSTNLTVSASGSLDLTYKLSLKIYIASGDDDVFRATIRAELDGKANIKAVAKVSYDSGEKEKELPGWTVGFAFGVIFGTLDINPVVNYRVKAGAKISAEANLEFNGMVVRAGAEWVQNRGWEKLSSYTAPTWDNWAKIEGTANIEVEVFPAMEVALLLFGIAGPEIALGPSFNANFYVASSPTRVCVEVDGALKAEANFVVDILGLLELVEKTFAEWNLIVWDDIYTKCF